MAVAVLGLATPAQAHDAAGTASCSGAVLDAGSYDGSLANTYTLSVDQDTRTGTFGASVHVTVPVPQDGAVHSWSFTVAAADGSYHFADSGQVGPCGTPPPTDVCTGLPGDQPTGTTCTPPPNQVTSTHVTELDCASTEQVTTTTTTTTAFVFDQPTQTWVPGTPVETQAVTTQAVKPGDCSTTPPVDHCPGVKGGTNGHPCVASHHETRPPVAVKAVPKQVAYHAPALVLPETGAPAASGTSDSAPRLAGAGALTGGVLLLAGLMWFRRRALSV
ncbi:hypothetical protein ABLE68_16735 [Nocardioides sp. CN2-186]|uniref:hypothetical protein n=1 Tax=Nocardioides tweenelious TaxID=3156607 RepID=UPI0032B3D768